MFKRLVIAVVVAALAVVAQPALAGKKKPKPWKSEEITLGIAHPVVYGNTGQVNSVTALEFTNTCAVPSSNGVDGYVFEIPKEYQGIQASISAVGGSAGPAGYDLDLYMYDANCAVIFAANAAGTDESSVTPKGTAFVFMHNYLGDPGQAAHLELKPY